MLKGLPALRRRKPSPGPNCRRLLRRSSQLPLQKGGCVANILVCDDERSICEMLDIALRRDGHRVETVNSGQAAKNKIDGNLYDLIITDIKMPNIDGIEVLRHAHRVSPDSPVILITAVDDYEAAVEAVKAGGASDYIRKSPGLMDEIKLAINRVLEKLALSKQNFALRRDAASHNSLRNRRKRFSNPSSRALKAARASAWRSSTRSCRRMKARCGLDPSRGREPLSS